MRKFVVFYIAALLGFSVYVNAQTFSNTPNAPITDLTDTYDYITVTGLGGLDVLTTVTINITHTYDADLDIYLIDPLGNEFELSTDNGGSGDNYTNTSFTNTAGTSITLGAAPFSGTFIPEWTTPPTGIYPNNQWGIHIFDDSGGDTGTLVSWSITFAAPPCPTVGFNGLPATMNCNDAAIYIAADDSATANGAVYPTLYFQYETDASGSLDNACEIYENNGLGLIYSNYLMDNNTVLTVYAPGPFFDNTAPINYTTDIYEGWGDGGLELVVYDGNGTVYDTYPYPVGPTGWITRGPYIPDGIPTWTSNSSGITATYGWGVAQFNPASAGPGTWWVTYAYNDEGGCVGSETQWVTINNPWSAAWTSPGTVCASSGTFSLNPFITGNTGGTWSGTGVSGSNFNPSGLSGPYNVTYSVGSGGSCSASVMHTITVTPLATANAGSDNIICAGSTYTVAGASYGGSATACNWTSSGSGSFTGGTTTTPAYTPSATDITNGTVTLTITATGPCAPASDGMVLTISPAATANAGSDGSICSTGSYTLGGSYGGSASGGTWSSSGTGTFSSFTAMNAVYTPSAGDIATGFVTITLTTNDPAGPCGAVSDNMTLTISPAATAYAGIDATICAGSTYTVSGANYGGGATSCSWSTSGDGTFTGGATTTPTYTPGASDITNGFVTLTINTNNPAGPCNAVSDNMMLNITPLADAYFAYSSGTFCQTGADPVPTINTPGGAFTYSPAGLVINGSTGQIDLDASTPQTYTVTYNTGGTCPNSSNVSVTITSGFDAEFSYSGPYCQGGANPLPSHTTGSDGTYTSSPAGLNFVNSSTGQINLATTAPGTYTITNTIAASGGCSADVYNNLVTIDPAATVNAGADAAICQGNTFSPSGTMGGSAANVNWSTSGDGSFAFGSTLTPTYTPGATDISNGSVTLTITTNDPSGPCGAAVDNLLLTINPAATVNAGTDATICETESYVLSGATMGGGASGVTWTSTGTGSFNNNSLLNATYTPSPADISAGIVTLTVTTDDPDGAGPCVAVSDDIIITIAGDAVVDAGNDATICETETYTLSGASMSGGATSVTWTSAGTGTFDNNSLLNATYTPGAADITAGTVMLTVTTNDPAGPCNPATDFITITINQAAIVGAGSDATICEGDTYTLSGTSGGSTGSVTWTSTGTGSFDNQNLAGATYTPGASDITNGFVNLVISSDDPAGPCPVVRDTMVLTINQAPVVSAGADNAICEGDSLTLAGTSGGSTGSVTWTSLGTGTFSNNTQLNSQYYPSAADVSAGSVQLVISTDDPAGPCNAVTDTMLLTIHPLATIDSILTTQVTSCQTPNATIEIYVTGGTPPYQYSINDGANFGSSSSFSGLNVGNYIIVVHGQYSCDVYDTISLTSASGPVIDTVYVTDILCYGDSAGELVVEVGNMDSLIYTIDNWGSFQNDSIFTGLPAGVYSVEVEDTLGCQGSFLATITESPELLLDTISVTPASCGATGGASVSASGGTPPYQYLWDTSDTTNTISNVLNGTYFVTVTDLFSCTQVLTVIIPNAGGTGTVAIIDSIMVSCYGLADGSATAEMTGGTAPYTYLWSTSDTTAVVSGLSEGTYTVTATDAFGCQGVSLINITQPDSVYAGYVIIPVSCFGETDGEINLTAGGGTGPYTFAWSTGDTLTSGLFSNLAAGGYEVTVIDNNGCKYTIIEMTVSQPSALVLTASGFEPVCYNDTTGWVTSSATGGTPPL
ncbi:MAG: proprotein convertase P-domain-containing protein, partial [Bacteroidota bacterium]